MACYAIGDLQGCFDPFQELLRVIDFNPGKDTLWLTGDLVNRGPASLQVLRWVYQHQHCVEIVLGNHDLHLLSLAEGIGKVHSDDTLLDILKAPDGKLLLDWLRCQPLMLYANGYAMVHAGILPEWGVARALKLAAEVERELSGPGCRELLMRLYGNKPTRWSDELRGIDRYRFIVNVMTRMRYVTRDGEVDLSFKGARHHAPASLIPWFEAAQYKHGSIPIICGHWSTLGLYISDTVIAIDTGCLWGGQLTAFRLEDREVWSLPCSVYRAIDARTN